MSCTPSSPRLSLYGSPLSFPVRDLSFFQFENDFQHLPMSFVSFFCCTSFDPSTARTISGPDKTAHSSPPSFQRGVEFYSSSYCSCRISCNGTWLWPHSTFDFGFGLHQKVKASCTLECRVNLLSFLFNGISPPSNIAPSFANSSALSLPSVTNCSKIDML